MTEPSASPAPSFSSPVSWMRRNRWALLASVVAAAGLVWLLNAGALPVLPNAEAQANLSLPSLAAYAALYLSALCVRGGRWYWLLAPLHKPQLLRVLNVSFVFYGASVALPFRMGEAVRPALIREKGKLSAWAAAGTVAAERVVDGLFVSGGLLLALAFATPIDPLPDHIGKLPIPTRLVPGAARAAAWMFLAAFGLILGFFLWRAQARALTERVLGLVSPKLGHWFADKVSHLADGLGFLPQLRFSLPFVATTAFYWLLNLSSFWVLMQGVGLEQGGWAEAGVVMGVLSLGLLVPNVPGFFGTFQIAVYAGLATFLPPATVTGAGSVFVFWLYTVQMSVCIVGGLLALGIEIRHSRRNAA